MDTLFPKELYVVRRPMPLRPICDRCGLLRACERPRLPVAGAGGRGVLVVLPPAGPAEDAAGAWMSGREGRWVRSELEALRVDPDRDLWVTGAAVCGVPHRDRPATQIEDCRPLLHQTVRSLRPHAVVLVGTAATVSFLAPHWKGSVDQISRWTGRRIPLHNPNLWACPLNDPEYLTRDRPDQVARAQFRRGLRDALALDGPPWPAGPPDYESRVRVVLSPRDAAAALREVRDCRIAFDFETDRLRPDHRDARIVCASVCVEGRGAFAFPWHGPVVSEMRRLLSDPGVGKIGWNIAFEHRWSLAKLGVPVANWLWDGMLAAHALDPRRGSSGRDGQERGSGTTGLKFQAFVRLGVGDYSSRIEPFLRPPDPEGGRASTNDPNRTHEAPLSELLRYCAMDSLLEWEICALQMAEASEGEA